MVNIEQRRPGVRTDQVTERTGGAIAGGGAGAAFRGSISTVLSIAPDQARGEALAGLFLAA